MNGFRSARMNDIAMKNQHCRKAQKERRGYCWHVNIPELGRSMKLLQSSAFLLVALIMAVHGGPVALAQGYPTRPITLVSPWPAGGASDALCRLLGSKLADRLGKPVVTENRPGAGSTIGVASVARAASDGYTLVLSGNAGLATSVTIYKKLPYDPTKDFAPVALVADIPFVLVVHPSLPVRSVPELVKLSTGKPDLLSYASGGPGSPHHLFAELLKRMTGIESMHVPYKWKYQGHRAA
jgi:tripartite-type tricarboxylate transporter receptor subunit TctC